MLPGHLILETGFRGIFFHASSKQKKLYPDANRITLIMSKGSLGRFSWLYTKFAFNGHFFDKIFCLL